MKQLNGPVTCLFIVLVVGAKSEQNLFSKADSSRLKLKKATECDKQFSGKKFLNTTEFH